MWIKPVFFFVIKISVCEERKIRLFFPLPIFWVNDLIESLADLAAFVNIITFGTLKMSFEVKGVNKLSLKNIVPTLYTVSDIFTELSLFTGRFDLVDVKVDGKDENVKVKISTF